MRRSHTILVALLLVACGSDPVLTPSLPTTISRLGSEVGTPGWLLSEGLSVVVRDDRGEPLEGVTVEWSSTEEGAWFGAASSETDVNGVATVAFAPGWRVGSQKVRATIGTLSDDATVAVSTLEVARVAFSPAGDACAIDADGAAWCWTGGAIPERSHDPATVPVAAIPVAVDAEHRYREIIAVGQDNGARHCGLTVSGSLRCWHFAGSGNPAPSVNAVATPVPLASLAAGGNRGISNDPGHLCGLDAEGQAWCQGRNDRGQLGDGTMISRAEFAPVAGAQRFQAIAAGATSFCGADLANLVWCWGTLGPIDDSQQELIPVRMAGTVAIGALAFSYSSPCGLALGEQRLVCWWGGNMEGVEPDAIEPVTVPGDQPIVDLAGTDEFGVFRFAGGRIGFAGDMIHDIGVNQFVRRPSELSPTPSGLPPIPGGFSDLLSRGSSWWCAAHQDGATLCSYRARALVGVPAPQ